MTRDQDGENGPTYSDADISTVNEKIRIFFYMPDSASAWKLMTKMVTGR